MFIFVFNSAVKTCFCLLLNDADNDGTRSRVGQ